MAPPSDNSVLFARFFCCTVASWDVACSVLRLEQVTRAVRELQCTGAQHSTMHYAYARIGRGGAFDNNEFCWWAEGSYAWTDEDSNLNHNVVSVQTSIHEA